VDDGRDRPVMVKRSECLRSSLMMAVPTLPRGYGGALSQLECINGDCLLGSTYAENGDGLELHVHGCNRWLSSRI
jgi:hypothetical protein